MAKPIPSDISASQEAWDADLQDNINIWKNGPFPVFKKTGNEADIATVYPPNQYEDCLVAVQHSSLGRRLYFCDGTNWKLVSFV